jgi:hypothetical protein
MKRTHLFCVAVALLLAGTANADLTVYEYASGEKVTLDTATGNYWIWDVNHFTEMTYAQQISAIAGLGTYGNIAGGWHMATYSDMEELWAYDKWDLLASFNETWVKPMEGGEILGRYDYSVTSDYHYALMVYSSIWVTYKWDLPGSGLLDTATADDNGFPVGAWVVVSDPTVIPAPGALVLAAIGLLSSLPGINRLRHRR